MATYQFRCNKCRKNFEVILSFTDYERRRGRIKCPRCASTSIARRITLFEVKTSRKS
jgi:putative FmdB family regulatory protein